MLKPAVCKTLLAFRTKIRRAIRKAKKLCVHCGGPLTFDTTQMCWVCKGAKAKLQKKYRKKRIGTSRKWLQKDRKTNPAKYAAREKKYYLERKLAGTCVKCTEPATEDSNHCQVHLEANRKNSREYQARKRAAKLANIIKMAA